METKHRLKPSIFISPPQDNIPIYCPDCGHIMEKVLHIPKVKNQFYQCSRCNTFIPECVYGLSDLK